MAKYCGGDEMEGCTDELTPLNMKTVTANSGMSSAIRNPRRPDSLVSVCQSVISQLILLPLTSIIYWCHSGCLQHASCDAAFVISIITLWSQNLLNKLHCDLALHLINGNYHLTKNSFIITEAFGSTVTYRLCSSATKVSDGAFKKSFWLRGFPVLTMENVWGIREGKHCCPAQVPQRSLIPARERKKHAHPWVAAGIITHLFRGRATPKGCENWMEWSKTCLCSAWPAHLGPLKIYYIIYWALPWTQNCLLSVVQAWVIWQLFNIPYFNPRADTLTGDSRARRSSMSRLNNELKRDSAGWKN